MVFIWLFGMLLVTGYFFKDLRMMKSDSTIASCISQKENHFFISSKAILKFSSKLLKAWVFLTYCWRDVLSTRVSTNNDREETSQLSLHQERHQVAGNLTTWILSLGSLWFLKPCESSELVGPQPPPALQSEKHKTMALQNRVWPLTSLSFS